MCHPLAVLKTGILGLLLSAFGAVGGCSGRLPEPPGHTVPEVDLGRYMGKWYEIASFPNHFQKGCLCTTAEYRLSGDTVEVSNACRKGSRENPPDVARAKAFPVKGSGNAKLKVQFLWPFRGDYWIIGLDDGYEYAMVGHPKRKYLWILSRTPAMNEALYQRLVDVARAKGYDVGRLQRTDQSCSDSQ